MFYNHHSHRHCHYLQFQIWIFLDVVQHQNFSFFPMLFLAYAKHNIGKNYPMLYFFFQHNIWISKLTGHHNADATS